MELLSVIVTALGTVLVTGIRDYFAAQKVAALQQQLGAMTYEKIAQQDVIERANAAKTTKELLDGLSDDELIKRVLDTNAAGKL